MSAGGSESVDVRRELLRQMMRIRAFELRALDLFEQKHVRGSIHPYIGMEAIAVGVCSALDAGDYVTSTHRGHGHCIARGLDVSRMMAELLGRSDGYCRGKGGSMHITALSDGMLGADAVVGGSVALAVGAAHALRVQGRQGVVVSFFGEGASNQGLFHEAANLAAVVHAPVVFVCENNEWALSTRAAESMAVPDVAVRASAYGFPGVIVDGNDVDAVRQAAGAAVSRARAGDGPTLIEAKSYRITPHSAATPRDARPQDELDRWRARDPIERHRKQLEEEGAISAAEVNGLLSDIEAELDRAVDFALESPVPDLASAFEDVYAPSEWPARLS